MTWGKGGYDLWGLHVKSGVLLHGLKQTCKFLSHYTIQKLKKQSSECFYFGFKSPNVQSGEEEKINLNKQAYKKLIINY